MNCRRPPEPTACETSRTRRPRSQMVRRRPPILLARSRPASGSDPVDHAELARVSVQIGVHLLRGRVQRVVRGRRKVRESRHRPTRVGMHPWPYTAVAGGHMPLTSKVVAGFEDRTSTPPRSRTSRQQARPALLRRSRRALPASSRDQLTAAGHPRGLRSVLGVQRERDRVDAVAVASVWSVGEDVAEVAATGRARHLGAAHEEAVVRVQLDVGGDGRIGEARPARARVELGLRREQLGAAAGTPVRAVVLRVDVLAAERVARSPCAVERCTAQA